MTCTTAFRFQTKNELNRRQRIFVGWELLLKYLVTHFTLNVLSKSSERWRIKRELVVKYNDLDSIHSNRNMSFVVLYLTFVAKNSLCIEYLINTNDQNVVVSNLTEEKDWIQ